MGGVKLKSRVAQNNGETLQMRTWIKTMREARSLSLRQLGERLGIQGNSVHVAERREATGGISIYQLQRIAAALDCDLFYAFVPKARSEFAQPQAAAPARKPRALNSGDRPESPAPGA